MAKKKFMCNSCSKITTNSSGRKPHSCKHCGYRGLKRVKEPRKTEEALEKKKSIKERVRESWKARWSPKPEEEEDDV